jgi:hypothetical protein
MPFQFDEGDDYEVYLEVNGRRQRMSLDLATQRTNMRWVRCVGIKRRHLCYSVLKLFTGFAIAALID